MKVYVLNDRFEKLYPNKNNLKNAVSLNDIFDFLIKTERLSNIFEKDIIKSSKHIKDILKENNIVLNIFILDKKDLMGKLLVHTSEDDDDVLLVKGHYEDVYFSVRNGVFNIGKEYNLKPDLFNEMIKRAKNAS